jgi:hypothetical protein
MTKTTGVALYLELRFSSRTAQVIIVPPVKNPLADSHEPLRILTRQISLASPRKAWRFYTSPARIDGLPTDSVQIATWSAVPLIEDIAPFLSGFSSAGWSIYKTPIAVEMSTDDLSDVSGSNTPNALIRRILRARTEAGYEETLFDNADVI